MKRFKLFDALCGWMVFAIAAATYLLTIEPTASFWDCGEFISSADKLDVGHPPGAPFFMLMGHFFSLFASDASHVAMCVNAMSALASAFTILFLFWTITLLARKLVEPNTVGKGIAILGAGIVGALAYTFSDTFWFSAVEGEVYASSSLFTAVVFWLILKWDEKADEPGSDRWLIAIMYLMGLSIGVHLLNLLTIPAIVLVYYFRRYRFSWGGVILAFLASVGILATILFGIIPGFPTVAGWFELLFTNGFDLPFNTGLLVHIGLTIVALCWAIWESHVDHSRTRQIVSFVLVYMLSGAAFIKESVWLGIILAGIVTTVLVVRQNKFSSRWLNTLSLMIAMILIGYSSYAVLVIRSSAQTPMDQNSPDNVFSLKSYLNREQYGSAPLLYGQTIKFNIGTDEAGNKCAVQPRYYPYGEQSEQSYALGYSTPLDCSKGDNVTKEETKYYPAPAQEGAKDKYLSSKSTEGYYYDKQFMMLFPRIYSSQDSHVEGYYNWTHMKGKKVKYKERMLGGENFTARKPTFGENLKFFFSYQVNFMYWRYFMWNFSGRQNDLQSYGSVAKGNWISGIPAIDNALYGDQDLLPDELKQNKGHNVYFMLPLLLGIIGVIWQCMKKRRDGKEIMNDGWKSFSITFLLFFLTGLAIVAYLNQTPYQPRERDYAYAGSFYAFCIWIGFAVLALFDWISKAMKNEKAQAVLATLLTLVCLAVPARMASENWDDHDRSGRFACRDFGANYLRSCESNGIIFSNGDNDTFPLWYNQEVEGEGTDLRVCNLSYLQTDWYIDQMKRPYYGSEALPITWDYSQYVPGKNEVAYVDERVDYMSVREAFDYLHSNDPSTKDDRGEDCLPTRQIYVLGEDSMPIVFRSSSYYTRSQMMIMEMLETNKWKRPIYFAVTVGGDSYLGLEPYFELTGLAYRITPRRSANGQPRVNIPIMYDNMMNKFRYGNMDQKGIYIDENLMRMCRTHRSMFAQLASAVLYEQHSADSALKVIDYCNKVLPEYNIPADHSSMSMEQLRYEAARQKGDSTMMNDARQRIITMVDTQLQYYTWVKSLSARQSASVKPTLNEPSYMIYQAMRFWSDVVDPYTGAVRDKELIDKYQSDYMDFMQYAN